VASHHLARGLVALQQIRWTRTGRASGPATCCSL